VALVRDLDSPTTKRAAGCNFAEADFGSRCANSSDYVESKAVLGEPISREHESVKVCNT
jgi:hypothetical protein